jgi:hypothetical protein
MTASQTTRAPLANPTGRPEPRRPPPSTNEGAVFEYVGESGLTAVSPVTGARYRFERPGARLAVDPRDATWLSQAANLRVIPPRPM